MEEEDYLEPTVVKENSPFLQEEETIDNDLDEEVIEEEKVEEVVSTPFEEELDDLEYEELDLPEPDEYEGDDEDELPAIVTGSIPTFVERKNEPVEEVNEEEKKADTSTLEIPLNFFKK